MDADLVHVELEPDLAPGNEPDHDTATTRTIAYSARQQNLEIPAGWRPRISDPLPARRCQWIFKDGHERAGQRCGNWGPKGSSSRYCWTHSGRGNLVNVEAYRLAAIEHQRMKMLEGSDGIVDHLVWLATNAQSEAVQLKASTEILDRIGIRGGSDSTVNHEVTVKAADVLNERLADLREKRSKIIDHDADEPRYVEPPKAILEADS